jgi:DNA-binding NarL/FixJ family response regulator
MEAEAVILVPHPILHAAIQGMLSRAGISLVAATTSPSRALHMIAVHHPELFVVEPALPDSEAMSGIGCIERSLSADPSLTVVALSGREDRPFRQSVLSGGAAAFVHKSASTDAIEATITDTLERARCGDGPLLSSLTPREREILAFVAERRTNAEVAQTLWLSPETVKFHLANVFRKLDVSSRTEAARWARRHGLTEPTEEGTQPQDAVTATDQVASIGSSR